MITAEDVKLTTLEYRYVSQTIWEEFIDLVFGANGSPADIQTIEVSLTADQIKTGNSIPIVVNIPAKAKNMIKVVDGLLLFARGGVDFTSQSFTLFAVGTDYPAAFVQFNGLPNPAARSINFTIDGLNSSAISLENRQLHIVFNADSAVGNGTMKLFFAYRYIPIIP